MAVLINPFSRHDEWRAAFDPLLADEPDVRWYPDAGDLSEIEYLIAWLMPRADLAAMTNLKAILCLGAGTEQWQKPDTPSVPVVRLADPKMADAMAAYSISWVVRHQRGFRVLDENMAQHRWKMPPVRPSWTYVVGILGYGNIGSRIGRAFADLGLGVHAWSRSGGDDADVVHYAGVDELDDFLGSCDAIVNVLPSTPDTRALLDADRLAAFKPDSLFVNIGRGNVLASDAVLIDALDHGPLEAAVLDVTEPEPPADDSPYFDHPKVALTGHCSGQTQVPSAARIVAANLAKLRAGETVEPLLDRSRGY